MEHPIATKYERSPHCWVVGTNPRSSNGTERKWIEGEDKRQSGIGGVQRKNDRRSPVWMVERKSRMVRRNRIVCEYLETGASGRSEKDRGIPEASSLSSHFSTVTHSGCTDSLYTSAHLSSSQHDSATIQVPTHHFAACPLPESISAQVLVL